MNTKISDIENKISDTSNFVTTTALSTKISGVENKIPDHVKYTTTPKINKLIAEHFAAGLKEADLVSKTDFDNKLTRFNKKVTSNKTKYLEVQKKLNSIITNYYNFSLGRMYFTSNEGSQNTFVYKPTLDTLELKKDKGTDYVIRWKSNGVYNSTLKPLYTVFLHSIKPS